MSDALPTSSSMSLSASIPELTFASPSHAGEQTGEQTGEQFLRLEIVPGTTALLPIQQIDEVLSIAIGQIVPIPHMPAWVMGVYNCRGEILWMIDLGHLCGLTSWYARATQRSTYETVVLQIHDGKDTLTRSRRSTLGVVIDRIEESECCDPDVIQAIPPSTVNSEFARFLRGFWWKSNDDMLAVLDGEAIMNAMPKR